MTHRIRAELDAGLAHVLASPGRRGTVDLVVGRPSPGERTVLDQAVLDVDQGLIGDCWLARGSRRTAGGASDPDMQVTIMNARVIDLIAGGTEYWPLAGDQLYVDLDLSEAALPPGSLLEVGTAVVEVTASPHRGCAKFRERFGLDAVRFVNSDIGRSLRLRGVNTRVVRSGTVRPGDAIARRTGDG